MMVMPMRLFYTGSPTPIRQLSDWAMVKLIRPKQVIGFLSRKRIWMPIFKI